MAIPILVLNYNGRRLLGECLPSVLTAAAASCHDCQVIVIDNASTDDSLEYLQAEFPTVPILRMPNRGLCSYNEALIHYDAPVAVLLNNDVKLDEKCLDPLIEPLLQETPLGDSPCFMTAPLCWRFDGVTYEGLKTAVCWRYGLVQGTSLFPGHESGIHQPGLTASAGAVLAVDRERFLALGGFDALYLPGRLEDLDFAFRGYMAGFHACYVPQAVTYHLGLGTFGKVYGVQGSDVLALRNTLLFQWKNLRHPKHLCRQMLGLPLRFALDVLRAPLLPKAARWAFMRALCGALGRWKQLQRSRRDASASSWAAERNFFQRFHPANINRETAVDVDELSEIPANAESRVRLPWSQSNRLKRTAVATRFADSKG